MSEILIDPTAETAAAMRTRMAPPASLDGLTIGLLDIGKSKGNIFLDRLEKLMTDEGLSVKRYAKPTNTKTAPIPLAQQIAGECDVVVEALSD